MTTGSERKPAPLGLDWPSNPKGEEERAFCSTPFTAGGTNGDGEVPWYVTWPPAVEWWSYKVLPEIMTQKVKTKPTFSMLCKGLKPASQFWGGSL